MKKLMLILAVMGSANAFAQEAPVHEEGKDALYDSPKSSQAPKQDLYEHPEGKVFTGMKVPAANSLHALLIPGTACTLSFSADCYVGENTAPYSSRSAVFQTAQGLIATLRVSIGAIDKLGVANVNTTVEITEKGATLLHAEATHNQKILAEISGLPQPAEASSISISLVPKQIFSSTGIALNPLRGGVLLEGLPEVRGGAHLYFSPTN